MQLNFDALSVKPADGIEKLPLDWYPVAVTKVEPHDDKKAIVLTLTVQAGHPFSGSFHNYRLGVYSDNQMEYKIAWEKLSAICHVTGVLQLNDSAQLVGIPFMAEIGPQKKAPEYNDVLKVRDMQGRSPSEIAKGAVPKPAVSAPQFAQQAPQAPPVPAVAPNQQWGGPPAPPTAPAFVAPQVGYPQQPTAPVAAPAWGAPPPQTNSNPGWAK